LREDPYDGLRHGHSGNAANSLRDLLQVHITAVLPPQWSRYSICPGRSITTTL